MILEVVPKDRILQIMAVNLLEINMSGEAQVLQTVVIVRDLYNRYIIISDIKDVQEHLQNKEVMDVRSVIQKHSREILFVIVVM